MISGENNLPELEATASGNTDETDIENIEEQPVISGDTGEATAAASEDTADAAAPKKESVLLNDWFLMGALYIIALVIHVLMTQVTTMFNLTPDEYAVVGIAAWANGYDWSATISAGGYYGYFQSLFYIPVFKLISDPATQYRAMLIINGVLMSFVPAIVYYLSRKWFGVRKLSSVFIAVICGMYPSYLLLTKYTWNETMCCLLPWVFALLMYHSLKSHKAERSFKAAFMQQLWAVLGGFVLVAAYASHGRMLALTAAGVVLELVVLIFMRRRLFSVTGFFVSTAGFLVLDKFIKKYIQAELWLSETKTKASANTIENVLNRLTNIDEEELEHFPQTFFGHFFYFISSTWGFGAICIVLIISGIVMYHVTARRAKKSGLDINGGKVQTYLSQSLAIFCWFALLCMGAIIAVSVLFKSTSTVYDTRADTAIFGRYIETFFPVAIFAALVMIYRKRFTVRHCFAAMITAAFIFIMTEMFTTSAVIGDGETTKSIVGAMILGLGPLRIGEGLKDAFTDETFLKIIGIVMVLLLAVVIIRLIKKKGESMFNFVALPLGTLLIYSTLYGFSNYTITQGKNASYGAQYVTEALSMIEECPYNNVVCYSMKGERYAKAQFLFPNINISLASKADKLSALEERPDFIISGRETNLNMWVDGVYLVGDINNNVQLYACSDEAIEWVKENGLELSESDAIEYTGENIPGTSSVSRGGESAMLPEGSAVYTNYFSLFSKGTYTITVEGANITDITPTLTSDKKANDVAFTIEDSSYDSMTITFSIDSKTENMQFRLTNKSGAAISVDRVEIRMTDNLVKEYDGTTLTLSDGAELDGTDAVLPDGAGLSTSMLIIKQTGDLAFRVSGENTAALDITLTSGGSDLVYERIDDDEGITINYTLSESTEDLKLTLTNDSGEEAVVYSVGYIRRTAKKIAVLPQ